MRRPSKITNLGNSLYILKRYIRKKDIFRFDVSVSYVIPMQILDSIKDLKNNIAYKFLLLFEMTHESTILNVLH